MADNELPKSDPKNPPNVSPGDTDAKRGTPPEDIPGSLGTGTGGAAPEVAAGTEPSGNSAPSTVPITASATPESTTTKPKPTHPNPNYPDQQLSQEEIEAQKPKTPEEAQKRVKEAEEEVENAEDEENEAEDQGDERRIEAAKQAVEQAKKKLERARDDEEEVGRKKSKGR